MLLVINAISGCDSQKKTDALTDMRDFGDIQSPPLECTSVVAAIQFVCSLYQENKATSNINQLRHEIFTKEIKSGDRSSPTLDVFVFYLCWANYQTFIWKSACVPVLNLPSSTGNGLQMEGWRSVKNSC